MKKLILLGIIAGIACGTVEARRWHRHGYRRGWGYGFGPSFSVAVPIGGGSPRVPAAVKQYNKKQGNPRNFRPSARAFCNWARNYFNPDVGQDKCDNYRSFLRNAGSYSSRPAGYVSFGVGGGYGPYWGRPYRRWRW